MIGGLLGGVLGAGLNLAGGLMSSGMAKDAGQAGAAASAAMFNQALPYLSPYATAGAERLNGVMDVTGAGGQPGVPTWGQIGVNRLNATDNPYDSNTIGKGFTASPGYQYQLNQALAAADNSAAARGGLLSGANIRARQSIGTDLASQDYWKYIQNQQQGMAQEFANRTQAFNNYALPAQWGLQAATGIMSGATASGGQQASALTQGGLGAANAMGSAFGKIAGLFGGGQSAFGAGMAAA